MELAPPSACLSLGANDECTSLSFSETVEGKRLKGVRNWVVEEDPAEPGAEWEF